MPPVGDSLQHGLRNFRPMLSVAALLRPVLRYIPTAPKIRISFRMVKAGFFQIRNLHEVSQIVRVAGFDFSLLGEFVTLRSLRDTGLQATLDGIASQVIRAIEQSRVEQRSRLFEPNLRKLLEVFPIHNAL
jgi:hypothetical protein